MKLNVLSEIQKPVMWLVLVPLIIVFTIFVFETTDTYAKRAKTPETQVITGNTGTSLLESFKSSTDGWWERLNSLAKTIFKWALILEIALFGIRMALQQTQTTEILSQFVMLLLFAGFIMAVISNYQEWAEKIAITGLKQVAADMSPHHADAGSPFAIAGHLWSVVNTIFSNATGIENILKVLILEVVAVIICVILFLIAAIYIIVTCEFYIVANVAIILIGLGGSKIFKEYAINAMRYVLAVAIKLFTLQLIINIAFSILSEGAISQNLSGTIETISYGSMFRILGQAIILYCVAKQLPETVNGILTGSSISGGNPIAGMARAAGGAVGGLAVGAAAGGLKKAAGAAGSAVGAAGGAAGNAITAFRLARAQGVGGATGSTFQRMRNNLSDARSESKGMKEQNKVSQAEKTMDANPSTTNVLKSRLAQAKFSNKNKGI